MWRLSIGYLLLLLLAYFSFVLIGERAWLPMALSHMPQVLWLPIALVLLTWSLFRRQPIWPLVVNSSSVAFTLTVLMGFRIHFSGGEGQLHVLTFNIAHCAEGADGIAAVIRQSSPDIICLQEATAWKGSSISRALDGYHLFLHNDKHNDLLIASRMPILSSEIHALDDEQEKVAQEAIIDNGGSRMRIVNVHLTPVHAGLVLASDPLGLPEHLRKKGRIKSSQYERLKQIIGSSPFPIIVAGDFNAVESSPGLREGLRELIDCFAAVGNGYGYTLPAAWPTMRRDYIFCGKRLEAVNCEVPAVEASDHRPVRALLALTQ